MVAGNRLAARARGTRPAGFGIDHPWGLSEGARPPENPRRGGTPPSCRRSPRAAEGGANPDAGRQRRIQHDSRQNRAHQGRRGVRRGSKAVLLREFLCGTRVIPAGTDTWPVDPTSRRLTGGTAGAWACRVTAELVATRGAPGTWRARLVCPRWAFGRDQRAARRSGARREAARSDGEKNVGNSDHERNTKKVRVPGAQDKETDAGGRDERGPSCAATDSRRAGRVVRQAFSFASWADPSTPRCRVSSADADRAAVVAGKPEGPRTQVGQGCDGLDDYGAA